MAAKHPSCATSSAERPLRSVAPTLARQYLTTIGRIVSSTSRSASRLPATASATTASRRSPEIVIGEALSGVTNGTEVVCVSELNNNDHAARPWISGQIARHLGAVRYQRSH